MNETLTSPAAAAAPSFALAESGPKLVEYSIVSVRRGGERLLPGGGGVVLVNDRMSGESFATWMIARFLQEAGHALPRADLKWLRVAYQVLDRWEEQSLGFESQQLEILRGIRRAIVDCCPPRASASPPELPPPAAPEDAAAELPEVPETPEDAAETAERDRVLAALVALGGEAATGELVRRTGLGNSQVRRSLRALEAQGRLRRSGVGLTTRYHAVDKEAR